MANKKTLKKTTVKKPVKGRGSKVYEQRQRGASHAGFHFHNLYQCCQVKWFTRFVLRIETKHTATPLINGHAFHEGKATFYKTQSKAKAINKAISEIKSREMEFKSDDEYRKTLDRCPTLLEHWIEQFGFKDLERFNFIAVEEGLTIKLNDSDFIFTVRPDAVVEEKSSKEVYILETKTSSFSIGTTELGVYYGDQATSYIYAVEKAYNLKVAGVIPDIAYWNKQSDKLSNIKCVRGDIVTRKQQSIDQFVNGLIQLQTIMAQKLEAYKNGYDPYVLFQRNTYYCNAFFKACEYAEICRNNLTRVKKLPPGFKKNRAFIKPQNFDYIEDTCAGID